MEIVVSSVKIGVDAQRLGEGAKWNKSSLTLGDQISLSDRVN
jgi:hypothetical protein